MKRHTVGEIMTKDVVSVRASTGYKEIVATLAEHRLSAVPVVGEDGRMLGVVSEADLMHKVEFTDHTTPPRLPLHKRVRTARTKAGADIAVDLMTEPAVVIGPGETVAAAARLMDAERIKRLPVVDDDGRLVGVVARADVLRQFLRDDEEIRREVIEDVLVRALWIDPTELTITVDRGVVALAGRVDRRSDLPIVSGLVQTVAGVVDVVNSLTYRYDDTRNPPRRDDLVR
jgi:CBS-domain-containing membrane protein